MAVSRAAYSKFNSLRSNTHNQVRIEYGVKNVLHEDKYSFLLRALAFFSTKMASFYLEAKLYLNPKS